MVERFLEDDELLVELPYLQRIREAGREEGREAGREEGREAGREEGREAGREEGREAGREEGRMEGRREGEAEMLLRLLRVRFGLLSAEVTTRVTTADPDTLLRWSERVLSAPTLEAVFAD